MGPERNENTARMKNRRRSWRSA